MGEQGGKALLSSLSLLVSWNGGAEALTISRACCTDLILNIVNTPIFMSPQPSMSLPNTVTVDSTFYVAKEYIVELVLCTFKS